MANKLIDYVDQVIALYDKVKDKPFYAKDINGIFPAKRMHMLTSKGYVKATGECHVDEGRKHVEWKFTNSGVRFINMYR